MRVIFRDVLSCYKQLSYLTTRGYLSSQSQGVGSHLSELMGSDKSVGTDDTLSTGISKRERKKSLSLPTIHLPVELQKSLDKVFSSERVCLG